MKPISPTAHGILDYGFALATAAGPLLGRMTGPARKSGLALAVALLGYTMTTDYKPAPLRKIPFKTHKKMDIGNLAGLLAVAGFAGAKDKTARRFFGALFALGVVNVLLTDWDAG